MPRTLLLATLITILSGPAYAETPSHRDQLLTEANNRAAQQQELDDDPLSPTWMQPRSPTKDSADYFWEHHRKQTQALPRCVHGQIQVEPIFKNLVKTELQRHHDGLVRRLKKNR